MNAYDKDIELIDSDSWKTVMKIDPFMLFNVLSTAKTPEEAIVQLELNAAGRGQRLPDSTQQLVKWLRLYFEHTNGGRHD